MPRKILPGLAAAVAALAATTAQAQDAVQFYGQLNIALESLGAAAAHVQRASNYRSVLGFRGSEDLGGGTRMLFQIEGTLAPDTGAGSPAARDTRIGIEGTAGTLFAGNWVTPYDSATSGLDPFYPTTAGYMSIMGNGAGPSVSNTSDLASFDRRQQNSVHYWTPLWHGLQLRVEHGLGEERPAGGARPALSSAAAVYTAGPWYAAATAERHHDYHGAGLDDEAAKLAGAYRIGNTRLALIGERLRYATPAGTLMRNAVYVSLSQQVGRHGVRLGATRAGNGGGSAPDGATIGFVRKGPQTGATHVTAGYDYTLSPRSSVFAYYTWLRNARHGVVDFAINSLGAEPGATLRGVALGLKHGW